ncbi:MAG: hypothetical protein U1B30_07840, partial [Pseudomonadota bacterium]|nr:hypothetical protein [Pseudomonadota bacterium]
MTKNNEKKLSGERWDGSQIEHGVRIVKCASWSGYVDFLTNRLLDYRNYVFRGHASEAWKLESTLDRAIKSIEMPAQRSKVTKKHLESFKYAV